ncbi:MAG TPA: PAS domain S-box protein [Terriglobia bacterium]|nr:PAS domain S-box protein [Terriglobia bacterium]
MPDRPKDPSSQLEQYVAAIVQNAEDAIISKDLESIVTSWNPAAERMFGYMAQEMIGQSIMRILPPELAYEEVDILDKIRRGERVEHFETRRRRKDGTAIDVSLTISPVRDNNGTVVGASKIARDISEKKMLEQRTADALEEARRARHEAELASRMKDEFLATISHELRTPLTSIVGWIRMLRTGGLPPDRIEHALEVIDRNVRSQAQLIEDLLDISRITMGKLRLDVRPVQPANVINAAVDSLRFAAEARNIRIQTVLDSHAGPVSGDFERLQQVAWNLVSNAIKFTPKGGRVQIVLERVNSHIEIRISDNGRGIKPEFLPFIFDRFTQAEASTTRLHAGIGMGLAISKAIIELHGGSITAFSEGEGKGSTFAINIPVMPVSTRPAPVERIHPKAWTEISVQCPPEISGLKILVVDDDPDTCDMIRAVLEQCGSVVTTVTDANTALETFLSWKPTVLISDIGLPEVDGYELMRRIRDEERARGTKTPAIALTAFARIEDRVKALAAGYQMHVAKPVEPGELLTIVASLAGFMDRR